MRLDPKRLVPAVGAGNTLPALLDAAVAGHTTHIVADRRVLAHLVPADTLVVTDTIEQVLLQPAVRAEATRFADEVEKTGYHHAGNTIGQLLGWLWDSSADAALRWFAGYATELTAALGDRRIARPPFDPLWKAVRIALDVDLAPDAVTDFEAAARGRLPEFTGLFTAAELAGQGRQRDADDPWPDATTGGRCFAKKRWSDVRVGDFVPNHRGAELDYDDGWCRVEQLAEELDATRVSLRDADGQDMVQTVHDRAVWLPTRSREPWQWGLPL